MKKAAGEINAPLVIGRKIMSEKPRTNPITKLDLIATAFDVTITGKLVSRYSLVRFDEGESIVFALYSTGLNAFSRFTLSVFSFH